MKHIVPNTRLMIVEYLLEHESEELYLSDFAKKLGIKVIEDSVDQGYSVSTLHELFGSEDDFDFCWANEKFISIKEMEKFIKLAKNKGATHLDIHFHADHGNYNLHALRFRMATQSEMEKVKKLSIKEKTKKVSEINKEIERLEKEKLKLIK